jgi:ATP-dependent Clp protease protease subunit
MHYRLVFNGPINETPCNALRHRIASILERPDFDDLSLLFSSDGGNTDNSMALYNFIRTLPMPVNIHAMGHVGSAAVPVFLAGAKRTCAPISRFFLHEYGWTFEQRKTLVQIQEAVQRLESDVSIALKIIGERTSIDLGLAEKVMRGALNPIVYDPEQAKAAGIVSEVLDLSAINAPSKDVAVWTVGW